MYLRKSTDERDKQIRSLEDQRAELQTYAASNGLQIVHIYEEKRTAKVPGRPVFSEMLAGIEKGEAQGILAWHPDRLARNSVDGGRIIHLIDRGVLQTLTFPAHWFEPTPQGKFMLSMAFGQSKYYVDNLSEVVKRSYRQKFAAGLWPVHPPFGYLHDKQTRGIRPDPTTAPLIRRMFERYSMGDITLEDLHREVLSWGLRTRQSNRPHLSHIYRVLQNPIYHGLMVFKGEKQPGVHEPIVSQALFDRVQSVIRERGKYRRQKHDEHSIHPFRGMFRCGECGAGITMEKQKGRLYLRCTKKRVRCSQRYVTEDEIREQVRHAVRMLSLPPDFARKLYEKHLAASGSADQEAARRTQALRGKLDAVSDRIKKLNDRYLDDDLTPEEYRSLKNPLVDEQVRLREKVEQSTGSCLKRHDAARTFLDGCIQAFFLAETTNLALQCRFLKSVGSNHFLRDKQMTFNPLGVWKTVAAYGPNRDGRFLRDRVSDEIKGDFLIGEGSAGLFANVLYAPSSGLSGLSDISVADPSTHPSTGVEGQTAHRALPVTV